MLLCDFIAQLAALAGQGYHHADLVFIDGCKTYRVTKIVPGMDTADGIVTLEESGKKPYWDLTEEDRDNFEAEATVILKEQ